jgi:tRNA-Thr(GGU) m(6)t(6)A37 methyltransferase TsaA
MSERPIPWRPIGIIHSPFRKIPGTPIQGVFAPEALGEVEVFAEFAEGLADIELFSHIYLLYAFDRAGECRLRVVPFLDEAEHGVFATRAPCRPNRVGLTVVELKGREGQRLRVAGIDVLDGTPLLDVKPYVPAFDCRPEATSGWIRSTRNERTREGADERFSG